MKFDHKLPVFMLTLAILLMQIQSTAVAQTGLSSAVPVKPTFEIDFAGGTVTEYVNFLRTCPKFDSDNRPCPVNILIAQNAKDYELPEIKVTTTMYGALDLLQSCGNEEVEVIVYQPKEGDGITTIQIVTDHPPSVTVINAKKLLQELDQKDLLEVIDVGLEMQGDTSKVELKLHEKSGLLFAKGTARSTQLVHNIVDELAGNSRGRHMGGMMGAGMGGPGGGGAPGLGGLGRGLGGGMGGPGIGGGLGGSRSDMGGAKSSKQKPNVSGSAKKRD